MKELGITKGGCIIDYDAEHCNYGTVDKSMAYPIICHDPEEGSCHVAAVWKDAMGDCEQNAKLIVDAFNTSNKTRLFPSELLERYNEALEALKNVTYSLKAHIGSERANEWLEVQQAEQTISKSK